MISETFEFPPTEFDTLAEDLAWVNVVFITKVGIPPSPLCDIADLPHHPNLPAEGL